MRSQDLIRAALLLLVVLVPSLAAGHYWVAISNLDKWLGLPPGTPDNIVEAYRIAFRKASADKNFLEPARRSAMNSRPRRRPISPAPFGRWPILRRRRSITSKA